MFLVLAWGPGLNWDLRIPGANPSWFTFVWSLEIEQLLDYVFFHFDFDLDLGPAKMGYGFCGL